MKRTVEITVDLIVSFLFRWAGYDVSVHDKVLEEYSKVDEVFCVFVSMLCKIACLYSCELFFVLF